MLFRVRVIALVALGLVLQNGIPAQSAAPLAGLHYLVGPWNCTYRAGAVRFAYNATYAYDRNGKALREIASWVGGSDEELLAYDAQRRGWTAVVLDDQGTATRTPWSISNSICRTRSPFPRPMRSTQRATSSAPPIRLAPPLGTRWYGYHDRIDAADPSRYASHYLPYAAAGAGATPVTRLFGERPDV